MSIGIVLDTRKLDALIARLPDGGERILGKIAYDAAADMQANFSESSPSSPGSPPGVDTGNLKNSIHAQQDGPAKWGVWGAYYGLLLESGTMYMAARPFIRAAAMRIAQSIPSYFKALVQDSE